MRTRNRAVVTAMCAGLAATLAACGGGGEKDPDAGTNGVGKLPATKIESKARQAAGGAKSVRLSGSLVTSGATYKLNMRLNADGGTGQVSTKGSSFELLRVGKELYLKADAGFWSHDGKSDGGGAGNAAGKLDNKYVKVPSGDPSYQRLSGFTDMKLLLDGLLGLHGKIATGDHGRVDGVRTITISAGKAGEGGSLDVSLEGRPYPLRLRRAGGAGVIRLADWNKGFKLTAPEKGHVLDYGQQIPETP
ncbi:hypothetical protein [Streptomyces rapamycinicus]|uniref:Lipoprotein n=2 Tax=Streptomyces rapamycinicus TaxID=1226757 RepID=A0A3L8RRT9_STRRN|nr:hypothetical protein [Streptomyces rapamycinicus]MBB4782726.1 hypothetical protein [Streptomyces rapamycinicus]RLV81793.1 lipoprotein [Streptomyces rapamycinicus NRRL 5491]UTO63204.1 hypothetical protein LJB45_13335 [Streptomyces rapamycinicus]UTP31162.1 hypothetical protein LIV37_18450 [Streptomyces rapamycinicus NRRL 5491]